MAISNTDATIGVVYLIFIVLLGVWVGRDQKDLSGYLLGNRDLPWWAILGSIVATETSTATFLSVPGIAFAAQGDMTFLQLAVGFILGRIIVAIVLVPLYFRGRLFTAYEVLEKRFGGATKRAASVMFLVTRNLGDGLRLFLAGLALEKVLGADLYLCVVVIGIATIVYTFLGGMKAVIWSDCIQFVIYMAGGLIALKILIDALPGGWGELVAYGEATDKFRIFDSGVDADGKLTVLTNPYTIWSGVIGGAVLTLGTHGTDQMFVQRYLSARNQRDASVAVVTSGFVVFAQFALFLLLGVALACFYSSIQPRVFAHNDEVFATFIVEQLPVGLTGITLAAVFAAAMSTLSSSLNSSAAAAVADFYRPWLLRNHPEAELDPHQLLSASRKMTVVFGLIQIAVGIGASHLSRSVVSDALAIAGFSAGILLGVFALGVLTHSAHQRGVFVGFLFGITVLLWIKFFTDIAWPWYAIIGSVTTFAAGLIASRLLPSSSPDQSPGQSLES